MRGARLVVVAAFVLAGCSSSAEGSDGEPLGAAATTQCSQRKGTFVTHYKERTGGTCGEFPDFIGAVEEQQTEITPPCTGDITYSANNCSVVMDYSCIEEAGKSLAKSEMSWNVAGTLGQGYLDILGYDSRGVVICSSVYDVTVTKR